MTSKENTQIKHNRFYIVDVKQHQEFVIVFFKEGKGMESFIKYYRLIYPPGGNIQTPEYCVEIPCKTGRNARSVREKIINGTLTNEDIEKSIRH